MGEFIPAHADCRRIRRAGVEIDRVVIHTTEGSMLGTLAWFKMGAEDRARATLKRRGVHNPTSQQIRERAALEVPTAAHFCVGRDGRVVQMVLEREKALHAGGHGYNDRSIGIELEAHAARGDFPDAMLHAAAELVADVCRRRGIPVDRTHVVGHSEVPGATHRDPGDLFPWDRFMAMVAARREAA
jgi:hypothetical protein